MHKARRLLVVGALLLSGLSASAAATAAGEFNITSYGAVANDATDDTAAVQRANDAAVKAGGGRVFVPDGTYLVGGVYLSSFVELAGSQQAVFKDPNGSDGVPIVRTHTSTTTGSIAKGSRVLTVANSWRIRPGVLVAVRAASGGLSGQMTTLTSAMSETSTALPMAKYTGFPTSGMLRVDDEAIAFSTTASGSWVIQRGALGTRAAKHAAGAAISLAYNLTSRVVAVSGTVVTLEDAAALGVSGVTVNVGTVGVSIRGLVFDGNKPSGPIPTSPFSVALRLTRGSSVTGSWIRRAAHGGVILDLGTTESVVSQSTFVDDGAPATRLGAAIWVFRGASNNVIRDNTISGETYHGIAIDDRTERATEWDGSVDDNVVEGNTVDIAPVDWNRGIFVGGGSRNVVRYNIVRRVQTGIEVARSGQGISPLDATYNTVEGNTLSGHKFGVFVTGSNNTFRANSVTASTKAYEDRGSGNVWVA